MHFSKNSFVCFFSVRCDPTFGSLLYLYYATLTLFCQVHTWQRSLGHNKGVVMWMFLVRYAAHDTLPVESKWSTHHPCFALTQFNIVLDLQNTYSGGSRHVTAGSEVKDERLKVLRSLGLCCDAKGSTNCVQMFRLGIVACGHHIFHEDRLLWRSDSVVLYNEGQRLDCSPAFWLLPLGERIFVDLSWAST